ncbi:MAG TPA: UDP-2,3-diacylglucosamine diphosphatase [Acidobacteriota bacterium]
MNLYVISDLHLNPNSAERNAKFIEFLQFAHNQNGRVLILGDLFDLWFGWKQLQFAFQADILFKMSNLATNGLRMDYLEGNRDFGISKLEAGTFNDVIPRHYEFTWGDHSICAEHGDLINRDDLQYRSFRALTKNPISYFLIGHLPSSWLLKIGTRLEKSLKNTNQKYRIRYPEEACKKFRDAAFQRGADIVIAGHFHQEKMLKETFNSRTVWFFNLPGWETGFRYLTIPDNKEEPYFTDF